MREADEKRGLCPASPGSWEWTAPEVMKLIIVHMRLFCVFLRM